MERRRAEELEKALEVFEVKFLNRLKPSFPNPDKKKYATSPAQMVKKVCELLRHADVRPFLHARAQGVEEGVAQEQQLPFPADPDATVHTFVWRDATTLRNAAETEAAATSDAHTLIGLRPKLPPSLEERTLLHRRLIKREPLSSAERGVLETELAAMGEWMTGEEEKATELHVVDTRSAEEKAAEAQVQRLLEADVAASA